MRAEHFEFLLEEPSMETFLTGILPKLMGADQSARMHVFQGKQDLRRKLPARLRAYANWLPETARIIVLIDRDDEDCVELKQALDRAASAAGLGTRTSHGPCWRVLNRIVIEELEAWYFGNWPSVCQAFPRLPATIPTRAHYRAPDSIAGGTAEALERILKRAGYFTSGLRKTEAARMIAQHFHPHACTSPSFIQFRDALIEAAAP